MGMPHTQLSSWDMWNFCVLRVSDSRGEWNAKLLTKLQCTWENILAWSKTETKLIFRIRFQLWIQTQFFSLFLLTIMITHIFLTVEKKQHSAYIYFYWRTLANNTCWNFPKCFILTLTPGKRKISFNISLARWCKWKKFAMMNVDRRH